MNQSSQRDKWKVGEAAPKTAASNAKNINDHIVIFITINVLVNHHHIVFHKCFATMYFQKPFDYFCVRKSYDQEGIISLCAKFSEKLTFLTL